MIILSLNELKQVSKTRGIKGYKNKSGNESIKTPSKPKPKINLSKEQITELREDFNELKDRFSNAEIKEIRRNFYETKSKK